MWSETLYFSLYVLRLTPNSTHPTQINCKHTWVTMIRDKSARNGSRYKKIIGVALVIADESARGWVGSKFARQAVGNFVFIVIRSLAAYTIALAGRSPVAQPSP